MPRLVLVLLALEPQCCRWPRSNHWRRRYWPLPICLIKRAKCYTLLLEMLEQTADQPSIHRVITKKSRRKRTRTMMMMRSDGRSVTIRERSVPTSRIRPPLWPWNRFAFGP
uniref:Putative secreted peptide n=1 Tax=Anopheles braziliensis TaxID=58242 RepID=A0A2M3ZNI8_9DIPT